MIVVYLAQINISLLTLSILIIELVNIVVLIAHRLLLNTAKPPRHYSRLPAQPRPDLADGYL